MSTEFNKLNVKKIVKETDEAVSLVFEVPDLLQDTYRYKPGQYLTLRFKLKGEDVRRAYSMSSASFEGDLKVTVKRVANGLVSNHVASNLKVGDQVDVMAPQGRFFVKTNFESRKSYYLFGAGSGITPLMSILKTILEEEPQSTVFLLYGNRNENSIIFKNELESLLEKYEGQLIVEHVLSQPIKEKKGGLGGFFSKGKISWEGQTGRINKKVIRNFLETNPKRYENAEYFICGPGNMIDTVEEALLGNGVPKGEINTERFTTASSSTGGAAATGENAARRVIVHLDGERIEVEVSPKKTILEALTDIKYEPPYSCRAGSCSTCMAKVTKGKVSMDACFALDDDEIEEGYVLACQAHPTTDDVELTFDV